MTRPSDDLRVQPGMLLLSAPELLDPNFMHTVVVVVQHDDDGALGLVVNRPTGATLGQLLAGHPQLGESRLPVHAGGPVGLDTLQILHRAHGSLKSGAALGDGLYLGADLESLSRWLAEEAAPDGAVRAVVGYAGWGAGQLDAELQSGSWVPRPLDLELVFSGEPSEAVWRRALRGLGETGEGLASLPPDPTWN